MYGFIVTKFRPDRSNFCTNPNGLLEEHKKIIDHFRNQSEEVSFIVLNKRYRLDGSQDLQTEEKDLILSISS